MLKLKKDEIGRIFYAMDEKDVDEVFWLENLQGKHTASCKNKVRMS
jgi:hypothetical protein